MVPEEFGEGGEDEVAVEVLEEVEEGEDAGASGDDDDVAREVEGELETGAIGAWDTVEGLRDVFDDGGELAFGVVFDD